MLEAEYEICNGSDKFRVRTVRPDGTIEGTCLIVQSGQMGRFDGIGAKGEQELYDSLTTKLVEHDVSVVRFDMKLREDLESAASREHVEERIDRIQAVLKQSTLFEDQHPVFLLGVSLGAQCVFELITAATAPCGIRGVVLIGLPIEMESRIAPEVQEIHLVYGERDYIAYLDEEDPTRINPIAPSEYAKWSVENLKLQNGQNCRFHLLPGAGHTLAPVVEEDYNQNPDELLLRIIKSIIKMVSI